MGSWWQLSGASSQITQSPQACTACGDSHLYKQADFKRALGLWIVGLASAATVVLFYFGFNWFLVWSPMLVALVIDRTLNFLTPVAVICYKCGHVHRGLSKEQCEPYEAFDLEVYDRLQYKDESEPA